jgi:hypothetical protein
MRSAGMGIVAGLLTLGALQAQASNVRAELFDAEVALDLQGSLERTRPTEPLGPLARSGSVWPRLSGTSFLRPLVNEPDGNLGLLEFYQHPGGLSLALTQENDFDRLQGEWGIARRALDVGAAVTAYPWHETGLQAGIDARYAGISGDARSALDLGFTVGVIHYFRPGLRGEASYLGAIGQSSRVIQSARTPAIEALDVARNGGRLAAEAILAQDRFGVRTAVEIDQLTADRTATALGGEAVPGDFTRGLGFAADATVRAYLGRDVVLGLQGGLRGESASIQPDGTAAGPQSRTTLAPALTPEATWFIRDALFVRLADRLAFPQVHRQGAPSSSSFRQDFDLGVGGRF